MTDTATNSPLALVDVMSVAHTPAQATRVSQEGANLFRSYIADQQASAGIPLKQRVLLQVVSTKAALIAGRKKTLAIVALSGGHHRHHRTHVRSREPQAAYSGRRASHGGSARRTCRREEDGLVRPTL